MPLNELNADIRRKEEKLADMKKKFKQMGRAGEWVGEHGLEALSLPTNLDDDSKKKRIAAEESENSLRMDCKRLGKTRDHEHAKYKSF